MNTAGRILAAGLVTLLLAGVLTEPMASASPDPSVVGTTTRDDATQYPFQRKTFYAAGRFWAWYNDGTNLVYRSSTDGTTWTGAVSVGAILFGPDGSVWFDGTHVHYCRARNYIVYYRRGQPLENGDITWSAGEQTVHSGTSSNNVSTAPMIVVDSGGYAWIVARSRTLEGDYYPTALKNANNDGTWSTAENFPYQLTTVSSSSWKVSVVPLTGGKVYAIYSKGMTAGYGKLWDGEAWGPEETTMSVVETYYTHSAVAQGDDVHLVFLHSTLTNGIRYNKRTYGVGWGTEATVQANADSFMAPVLSIDPSTNDLYCFYSTQTTDTPPDHTAHHIYYRVYDGASWGSPVDWIDESTDVLGSNARLTCFYQAYNDKIGLLYVTKTASPFNVKFDFMTLIPNNSPNWLTGWNYRMEIMIDYTKIDETLTDFPVTVFLDSSNFDFSHALSTGYDIRFTSGDGTTLLPYERERHDQGSQKAEYHVKNPSVSPSSDTVFYMYCGKADAPDGANPTAVWDDNFMGVWHLSEDPSGTAPQMLDSTSNDYDGTSQGSMTSGDQVEGQIDGSLDFDGTDDYIDCENGLTITGPVTVEAWGKIYANDATVDLILTKYSSAAGIYFGRGGNNKWTFQLRESDATLHYIFSNENSSPGTQTYLAGKWDGSTQKIYVGAVEQTDTDSWSGSIGTTTNPLCIGSYIEQSNFNGTLDEIRVSNVARSAAWIKASYESERDNLISFGSEETSGTPPDAPTSLLCEDQTNPTQILDLTPSFSAIGTDNEGDQMGHYALQVDDDIYFGSPIWNQTKTSITAFDSGTRCEDITYAGSSLVRGTTYYWRIKFWDVWGVEGIWSTEAASFKINQLPTVPTNFTDLGMNLTDHTPTITWTKGTDGDGDTVTTCIYLGTTSTPTEIDASTTGEGLILGENVSHSCYPLADGGVYYYRLRSWDGYEFSGYTTADEFRMNSLPSADVVSPKDGAGGVSLTPTLDWSFSDGEGDSQTEYRVMVDNDMDFSSPAEDTGEVSSDNTHYAVTTPLDCVTTYYWKIMVRDGHEWAGWQGVWNFTTTYQGTVLWEHYNTGDDSVFSFFDWSWEAQTFTVGGVDHTVTSIKVKIFKKLAGSWPGTCYISIRATDENGHPTGGDLTGTSFDGHLIADYPGGWYEFYVPEYALSADTKYAIVLRAPSGYMSYREINWWMDATDLIYDGGNVEWSTDSGSSWTAYTDWDHMFEIWSTSTPPEWTEVEVWIDYFEITGWNTAEVWTDYFYHTPYPDVEVLLALLSVGVIAGLGLVGFNTSKGKDPVPGIFMMSVGVLFTWWIGWLPLWILITAIALIAILGAVLWGKIFHGGGG